MIDRGATDWPSVNPDRARDVVARETRTEIADVIETYGTDFHVALHPDLSGERIELLGRQKAFLLRHDFIKNDLDIREWIDPASLQRAKELVSRSDLGAHRGALVAE